MPHTSQPTAQLDSSPTCPTGTIVALLDGAISLSPSRCRRWACHDCGWRNARTLAERISHTDANRFITLTIRHEPGKDAQEQLDTMNAAWRTLWKRIKRKTKGKAVGYVKVVELTRKGTPHFHVAISSCFLSQRWLSSQWNQLTNSPVVDIRLIRSARSLARYLAKYLTKASDTVSRRRKFSAARGFLPPAEGRPIEADELPPRYFWQKASQSALETSLAAQGYRPLGRWWVSPGLSP